MKNYILTALLLLSSFFVKAQVKKDSSLVIPMFQANYSFNLPGADYAKRFGASSSVGPSFMLKTRNYWMIGAGFSYFFGNNVKQDSMFHRLKTSNGEIIDGNGTYAQVYTFQRAIYPAIYAGKMFRFYSPNANSGLTVLLSAGLFEHKIRIDNPLNTVPQLRGDYRKGYDRLTNGIAITEFVGYYYLGSKRFVNFYGGIEVMQAWTKCRRDYNFDDMATDNASRFELQYGFKIGWIIPLYKKKTKDFYFY